MYVLGSQLGLTPVYKCTATICYGADGKGVGQGTDGLFRNLQTVINKFAARAGFRPVTVDGKLGASTVSAARTAGDWTQRALLGTGSFGAQLGPYVVSVLTHTTSKEALAQNAQTVYDALTKLATAIGLDGGGAPVQLPEIVTQTSSYPPAPSTLPVTPTLPPEMVSTGSSVHWAYYAAGAVAALGVLFAVWQFTKPTAG